MPRLLRYIDRFTLMLAFTVVVATLLPCRGVAATALHWGTNGAIALLFFLHGAKLSRASVLRGMTHWRLHLTVLAATFVLFPLLGLAARPLGHWWLTPSLYAGFLFLCTLPSTVQSSIAFTSMARGNVPAAVVSASLSNLLGLALTPLLAGLLLSSQGHVSLQGVLDIVFELALPFVLGHLSRPWTGDWMDRHPRLVRATDQGVIVLVVYAAFGAAVVNGLWRQTPPLALAGVLGMDALLLFIVLLINVRVARALRFPREDEITIVFCGSKKSMASGIPMAQVLFAGQAGGLGALVLPLMIYHSLQLMVCAVIAQRYAAQAGD